MGVIIYDFEVFKKDALMGALVVDGDNQIQTFQSWDFDEIKWFYFNHYQHYIWIGHNNTGYDGFILQSIVEGGDPKRMNDEIIVRNMHRYEKLRIPLFQYDLFLIKKSGLKTFEAFDGKDIAETEVDFNLDRKLTDEEKRLTEKYNMCDLEQTLDNFNKLRDGFDLRCKLLKEFGLPLDDLTASEATLASKVLCAKKVNGIENQVVNPVVYDSMRIANKDVLDFYLSKRWATEEMELTLCGCKNKLARGGIHGALEKVQVDEALYIDVSGYYNLIMINFGLLPRGVPQSGAKEYERLYHEQLKMKKTNPQMRAVFKVILLAVTGAMNNEYLPFYDPYHGDLMRMVGQMFLVDLLEKLDGKVQLIQSNTDGIIIKPINGYQDSQIKEIVDEWTNRTGFTAKFDKIYNIWQRDVNNYIYQDDKGEIHTKGESVKHYNGYANAFVTDAYSSKEPIIIAQSVVEYLINGVDPADTIKKFKDDLRLFQYICKPNTYDYLEYRYTDENGMRKEKLQKVNRAFAMKNKDAFGMIYKCKKDGACAKVASLPSVFVYNKDIRTKESIIDLQDKIDYNYYERRAWERIGEFVNG